MRKLAVDVSFDEHFGYVGSGPELRSAVRALSLNGLRKLIEDQFPDQALDIKLSLDKAAQRERDARRNGGSSRPTTSARRGRRFRRRQRVSSTSH